MVFWGLMFIVVLITPLIMIVVGNRFVKNPTGVINEEYGYRTEMSMKNQDTWDFANRYCGRVWRTIGAMFLPVILIVMLIVRNFSNMVVGITALALIAAQVLSMYAIVFFVEKALRRTFDENGKRRKPFKNESSGKKGKKKKKKK